MAMADLARQSDELRASGGDGVVSPVSIASVANRQHISQTFLEQIFMLLRRGGLVASSRGPGGGYVLARAPQEISIFEIMQAVDEPVQMTRCSHEEIGGCVAGNLCLTHGLWQDLGEHIAQFLSDTSLQDVLVNQNSAKVLDVTMPQEAS